MPAWRETREGSTDLVWERAWKGLGLGRFCLRLRGKKERERQNEWMDGQKKEGRNEKPQSSPGLQRSQKGCALALRKFLVTRAHGALHFHLALGSANYVTGPSLGKDLWRFHCMKWMESLFSVFLRFKQLSINWGGVGQLWILWLKLQTGPGLKLILLYPDFIAEEHSSLHPGAGDLL